MPNPISGVVTKDGKTLAPGAANHLATDAVLWALIQAMINKGEIYSGDLLAALDSAHMELAKTGTTDTQADADRFAASLAVGRVIKAIKDL
ncbi:hypothetical protein [Dongia sedimenti]|uniref:Uncharacterized protein n=1 Tax=Dongia sedimenti TaxID=3064282 RepID=A0ABU0YTJ1_9PROT|nr:hypothetical protein [Rhodospirillaceae bacterium R-7]